MAYSKAFGNFEWKNRPNTTTPLGQLLLNRINTALDTVDDRVIELDTKKAGLDLVNTLVKSVEYNEENGCFTITKQNGSKTVIDTKIEKLAVNFVYDAVAQQLIVTLDDGEKQYVDLSALITQYEFKESDVLAWTVGTNGSVTAVIKTGSITDDMLESGYLAKLTAAAATAQNASQRALEAQNAAIEQAEAAGSSAQAAAESENAAKEKAQIASSAATIATEQATAAKNSAEASTNSALESANKASEAALNAAAAAASESSATGKAAEAAGSAENASESKIQAAASAQAASSAATVSTTQAEAAGNSANLAKSYATGGTGTRDNEDTDNAKYYCEKAKAISNIETATPSSDGLMSSNDKAKADYTNIACGTCETAAGTAEKAVTIKGNSNWTLKEGAIIIVKFTNTNTASNVKINVNGTGAKSIWYSSGIYTGNGTTICGYAGRYYAYMYDGTYWVWIGYGVDANTTYSNMTGATTSAAGKAGLVPAPAAGYNSLFLRGDGRWAAPAYQTPYDFDTHAGGEIYEYDDGLVISSDYGNRLLYLWGPANDDFTGFLTVEDVENGKTYEIFGQHNSNRCVISDTAPSDTSALWVS